MSGPRKPGRNSCKPSIKTTLNQLAIRRIPGDDAEQKTFPVMHRTPK